MWIRKLRLWAGVAVAVFVVLHLSNHMVGTVSIEVAEGVRRTLGVIYRSRLGQVLLYGALATHVLLALWSLYRRSHLRMPAWEAAQILIGLAIPVLLALHVVGTRGFTTYTGVEARYASTVAAIWSGGVWSIVKQSALVLVVWGHLMVGLHFWLRVKAWYPRALLWLYPLALLLPALALLGFYRMGFEVSELARSPGWLQRDLPDLLDTRPRRVHDDGMGLDAIRKAGQWGGAFMFYGGAVVWVRELFTRPNRDVFVDMIGSVVSLHSLYLGAAVGSAILALGCSWSGVSWAIGFYKRWKDKRIRNSPSGKFRRLHNVVVREFNLIEQDRAYEHDGASTRSQASKCAQREILGFELSKCGLATPDPETDSDEVWYEFISRLMPLSQHGRIEEARTLGATFDKRKGQS